MIKHQPVPLHIYLKANIAHQTKSTKQLELYMQITYEYINQQKKKRWISLKNDTLGQ